MAVDGVRRPHARDAAWDSAFYRFAEGVRALTGGQVNYKILYAMVGTNGRYVNHVNAIVRKRTAAAFSRLIHSSRYALDFQEAYRADDAVFALAAAELVASLRETTGLDDAALTERLLEMLDEGVVPGLANERSAGRTEVNLARLDCEASSLAGWCRTSLAEGRSPLEELTASIFHMVAFGHLDERFARMLLVPTPLDASAAAPRHPAPSADAACLIRVADDRTAPLGGAWVVDAGRPFSIGRYADCDAIETDPFVSRLHCRIFHQDGAWYVEDSHSSHGTCVLRGETAEASRTVFDSRTADSPVFGLSFGDRIVLAGRVTYWFRSLEQGEPRP